MPQLNLYVDTANNRLVAGLNNAAMVNTAALPLFFGDYLTLNIYLLNYVGPQGNGNSPYSIISTEGLSLQVYVDDGTISGDTYTQQVEFTSDPSNSFFTAQLPLNTPALETLLGDETSASAYLKIGYISNGQQTTVFSGTVVINVGLPQGQLEVAPGLTALSVQVAQQTFVPIQPVAGEPIYIKSLAGKIIAIMAVDNPDGTASVQMNPIN